MIVVADTTPIHYLILIESIDLLGRMYGRVVLPLAVRTELLHPRTPDRVRSWMEHPPLWIDVRAPNGAGDASLGRLGAGEREAILLAEELPCDQLIVDEALGRRIAEERGLPVIGTIGVLREAAERGLLDLRSAFERLSQTSFHISPAILAALLEDQADDSGQ
jgi:predicted nucleic acid-binding protein